MLDSLADHFEKLHSMKKEIRDAFIYPCIVSIAMLAVFLLASFFLWREAAKFYEEFGLTYLPWSTILFGVGEGIVLPVLHRSVLFWLLLIIFLASLSGVVFPLGGDRLLGRLKFSLPLYGAVFRNTATASFCRGLGILLEKRLPLADALRLVGNASPSRMVRRLSLAAAKESASGKPFSEVVETFEIFPRTVRWLISVAEKRGNLAEELQHLGGRYAEKAPRAAARFAHAFEILLIIVMGSAASLLIFSIFLPLISLIRQLSAGP